MVGLSIDELIPHSKRAQHHKHVAGFTTVGTSRMMGNSSGKRVFKGLRKDGTTAHIQIGINLIKREMDTVYIIAVSDCDELHQLTENLKLSNLELQSKIAELEHMKYKKNHFMTVMSHELRTPPAKHTWLDRAPASGHRQPVTCTLAGRPQCLRF